MTRSAQTWPARRNVSQKLDNSAEIFLPNIGPVLRQNQPVESSLVIE
jgi:hypothetical protein